MREFASRVTSGLVRALDRVTPARGYLVVIITALLVLHGLAPRGFLVDSTTVGLLGVLLIVVLVPLLKSATLPGGGGLDFRENINQLRKHSEQAEEDQYQKIAKGESSEPQDVGSEPEPWPNRSALQGAESRRAAQERSTEEVVDEILRGRANADTQGFR